MVVSESSHDRSCSKESSTNVPSTIIISDSDLFLLSLRSSLCLWLHQIPAQSLTVDFWTNLYLQFACFTIRQRKCSRLFIGFLQKLAKEAALANVSEWPWMFHANFQRHVSIKHCGGGLRLDPGNPIMLTLLTTYYLLTGTV